MVLFIHICNRVAGYDPEDIFCPVLLNAHNDFGGKSGIQTDMHSHSVVDHIYSAAIGAGNDFIRQAFGYGQNLGIVDAVFFIVNVNDLVSLNDCHTAGAGDSKSAVAQFNDSSDTVGGKSVLGRKSDDRAFFISQQGILAEGGNPQAILAVGHNRSDSASLEHGNKIIGHKSIA